ncbi:MAG TPA: phosphatase PAP2 family protein [Gallionellaceae bacterium]|nr:phosphatase PAP2 family protein [Gallionellaceae bacterium]
MSTKPANLAALFAAARAHFWLKTVGITAFIWIFFLGYFYVLRHPEAQVALMPLTALDRLVGVHPLALPVYLSLWVYVSLPPGLMLEVRDLARYGLWAAGWCVLGLGIFYFWPTAVPPSHIDWSQYPGMGFLKGVDGAGNACPSLHVTAAVFSAVWLHRQLRAFGLGRGAQAVNIVWCLAILYSTMATRQHVALDVAAGTVLGAGFAWASFAWGGRTRAVVARNGQSA